MTLSRTALSILAGSVLFACAGTRGTAPVEVTPSERALPPEVDVEHYALEIALFPEERRVEGRCTVRLFGSQPDQAQVLLDFVGLEVLGIEDELGRRLEHRHDGDDLEIDLAAPLARGDYVELTVRYAGSPRKGVWFVGGGAGTPTHMFTQGGCEDSRWWFPCHDVPGDRATSEIVVDMPAHWTAVAAGQRVASGTQGARKQEHWRMDVPHPPYLMTLVAGDLVEVQDSWYGVPLTYLAPPAYADRLESSLGSTPEVLSFLTEITGRRYPFPKYSQACVDEFPFGGMENISATTLTLTCLKDERGMRDADAVDLVVHEAAHQWFGDLLTCREWSHIWLNEGFASYMTLLWIERTQGVDAFRARMRDLQLRYLKGDTGQNRRAIVHDEYRDPKDLFFGGHTYEGGASRLHLLRFVLGDEAFFRGIRRYVGMHAGRGVVTDDLRTSFEEVSGTSLDAFFEQWLESPGYPEFEVHWRFDEDRQRVLLTVNQAQKLEHGTPEVFQTLVDVEVRVDGESELHRLTLDARRHLFEIEAAGKPEWVRFDKYGWIPCRLREQKDVEEWLAIAAHDDDVNGRLDAVRELGATLAVSNTTEDRTRLFGALLRRLEEDSSAPVRAAAAGALAGRGGAELRSALVQAARDDQEASVRVAAIEALAAFAPDASLLPVAEELFDARSSWATMGAAAHLAVQADPAGGLDWVLARLSVKSPHSVLRADLVEAAGGLDDPRVLALLQRIALDERAHEIVRVEAVAALGRRVADGDRIRETLTPLTESRLARLRMSAIEALAALARFGDERASAALGEYYKTCIFPREKRAIEAVLAR